MVNRVASERSVKEDEMSCYILSLIRNSMFSLLDSPYPRWYAMTGWSLNSISCSQLRTHPPKKKNYFEDSCAYFLAEHLRQVFKVVSFCSNAHVLLPETQNAGCFVANR